MCTIETGNQILKRTSKSKLPHCLKQMAGWRRDIVPQFAIVASQWFNGAHEHSGWPQLDGEKNMYGVHVARHRANVSWRVVSGGCRCALVGVPWRWSVSARLAWGDLVSLNMLSKVLKMLSILRRQGTPMGANLQLPDCTCCGFAQQGLSIWTSARSSAAALSIHPVVHMV